MSPVAASSPNPFAAQDYEIKELPKFISDLPEAAVSSVPKKEREQLHLNSVHRQQIEWVQWLAISSHNRQVKTDRLFFRIMWGIGSLVAVEVFRVVSGLIHFHT